MCDKHIIKSSNIVDLDIQSKINDFVETNINKDWDWDKLSENIHIFPLFLMTRLKIHQNHMLDPKLFHLL